MVVYVRHCDRRITNLARLHGRAKIATSWLEDGAAFLFVSSGDGLAQFHDAHPAALSGILLMAAPQRSP